MISSPIRESLSKKSVLFIAGPVITGSKRSSSTGALSLIKSVTVGVTKDLNNLNTGASKKEIFLSCVFSIVLILSIDGPGLKIAKPPVLLNLPELKPEIEPPPE